MNVSVAVPRKGPPKPADAVSPIDSSLAPHEMRDPFDIGEALAALAASGDPVTVYAGTVEPALARIESVDPELPHFVFDFTGSGAPPAGPATFVAALGGNAKLQFELDSTWTCLPGQPHLVPAEFPDACLVLNRRAARRVEPPVGGNFTASFSLASKQVEFPVYDFSLGGVGLRASREQCAGLTIGKKLIGVRLELGAGPVIVADLEVRLLRPFRTFLLGEQVQIGCSFTHITAQMQQLLERFVSTGGPERRAANR